MKNTIRYLLGVLLLVCSPLAVLAQYNPDSPDDPGSPADLVSYNLTLSNATSGAGVISGTGKYKPGTAVTVSASARSGYKFLYWTKDEGTEAYTTSATFSYTMEMADVHFTAVYEKAKSVTVKLSDSAAGSVSGATTEIFKGGTTTVSTTANTNYEFQYWLKDDETEAYSTNTSFIYTVDEDDVVFTAVYKYVKPVYDPENPDEPGEASHLASYNVSVTLNNSEAGSVSGAGKYLYGKAITIRTSANAGYTFQRWLKDGEEYSTSTSFTYTVEDKDVAFTAEYEKDEEEPVTETKHVYLASSPAGSSTFDMESGTSVDVGASYSVTAMPGTDYVFQAWYKDGELAGTEATYTGTMGSEDVTLTAKCVYVPEDPTDPGIEDEEYTDRRCKVTVVSSNETMGTVSTTGITPGGVALSGNSVTVTAVANDGYVFAGWLCGTDTLSKETSYTFTVEKAITLVAKFCNPAILGDANDDGEVDEQDAQLVTDYLLGKKTASDLNSKNADANQDEKIDIADIPVIIKIALSSADN